MRYFIVWVILLPWAASCQVKEVDLQGTWHYERRSRPETGFTMSIDGVDVTDELNDETGDGDGMDHFYLVFDGPGKLIENFEIRRFEQDINQKDRIYLDVRFCDAAFLIAI